MLQGGNDMKISFFFQAEDGIRDRNVTGVQTCALPIFVGDGGGNASESAGGGTSAPGSSFPERQAATAWLSVETEWARAISSGHLEPRKREDAWFTFSVGKFLYLALLCTLCAPSSRTGPFPWRLHPRPGHAGGAGEARQKEGGAARGGRRGRGGRREVFEIPALCRSAASRYLRLLLRRHPDAARRGT